jgi:hypothetical protein
VNPVKKTYLINGKTFRYEEGQQPEYAVEVKAQDPVQNKAVKPVENKAVKPAENKKKKAAKK